MENREENLLTEQDLSESKLVEQEPLEEIGDPAVRLAGYNQIPDFGNDIAGTLNESGDIFPKD